MKPPTEFKILRIRECPPGQSIETPEQAAAYWRANIPQADWYDPAKEAFVVLVLNTRRRIIGHNLVTLGTLDTCNVHSREVFRPVICAAGSACILMHNHPSGDCQPSEGDNRGCHRQRDERFAHADFIRQNNPRLVWQPPKDLAGGNRLSVGVAWRNAALLNVQPD